MDEKINESRSEFSGSSPGRGFDVPENLLRDENSAAPQARKKRILFVITQSEMGGAQRFLSQLITNLPRDRFECIVVVGQDGDNSLKRSLPTDVQYITAQHLFREPDPVEDLKSLFELRRIYREQKPDIIFLNSSKAGFNGSWAASALPGKVSDATIIYRIGGWSFNDPRPQVQKVLATVLEKISDSWKDYIVVNNTRDLGDAKRLNIKPRKDLLLIYNGIDPYTEFTDKEHARTEIFGQNTHPQAQHLIGVIANFYPAKGLVTLIEAVSSVKSDATFIVIGDGQQRMEIESAIRTRNLGNRVILAGRIPNADRLVKAFDAFVLPSLKEGFPWSILEAMAAKVPVIATRVGAVPEIIEDGRNGLSVEPGNSDQLAKAIDKMLGDENLRMQCAIEAHQTIIHRFSLTKMVNAYIELFSRN